MGGAMSGCGLRRACVRVREAAARFTEALNQGEAQGLIAEMGLNPSGLGVEPFLRALQASADAAKAKEAEAEPMETDGKGAGSADKPEPMDQS